jgi:hypothetical protein
MATTAELTQECLVKALLILAGQFMCCVQLPLLRLHSIAMALTLQCGSKMARSLPDTKLGRSVRW